MVTEDATVALLQRAPTDISSVQNEIRQTLAEAQQILAALRRANALPLRSVQESIDVHIEPAMLTDAARRIMAILHEFPPVAQHDILNILTNRHMVLETAPTLLEERTVGQRAG